MVLEQVVSLQVKLDIRGIQEDYLELFEPRYLDQAELEMSCINWDVEEEDDIQLKTKTVLERTIEWVNKRRAMKVGNKIGPTRDSEVALCS